MRKYSIKIKGNVEKQTLLMFVLSIVGLQNTSAYTRDWHLMSPQQMPRMKMSPCFWFHLN